jgi:triphosphoribosyl-dephospho-CoA synthase
LPALFDTALPVYRATLADGGDCHRASFAMLARLMQVVDDTTSLHRCGPVGLARLRRDGASLERLVAGGDDFRPFLSRLNREYVAMNLTMGGVADLLALAFGCLAAEGRPVGRPFLDHRVRLRLFRKIFRRFGTCSII